MPRRSKKCAKDNKQVYAGQWALLWVLCRALSTSVCSLDLPRASKVCPEWHMPCCLEIAWLVLQHLFVEFCTSIESRHCGCLIAVQFFNVILEDVLYSVHVWFIF